MIDDSDPCPCYSGFSYSKCCKRFHDGELPKTALELMRSRYAAYALNKPNYIIETTHPENPKYTTNKPSWRKRNAQFSERSVFKGLDILAFIENGETATVTFRAELIQGGHDATFTEKSLFKKRDGHWLYLNGEIYE